MNSRNSFFGVLPAGTVLLALPCCVCGGIGCVLGYVIESSELNNHDVMYFHNILYHIF